MSILQTELAEQNNSKILPVKIKIGFFSIVFYFLLLFSLMLYTHTLTRLVATGRAGWSSWVCVCVGGGGEGVDYDRLQRNMANSGFMRMLGRKTQRDIFERNTPQM
jgi:hypothetical protein